MPAILEKPAPQLELLLTPSNPLEEMNLQELREACLLPVGGFPPSQQTQGVRNWMEANRELARRIRKEEVETFASQGSAQTWFAKTWKPKTKETQLLAEALENAVDVVEALYPKIKKRGLNHPEDMGILLAHRCGKAEGILAKTAPYDQTCLHIEIHCVTGPWNFDPSTEEAHFEPGAQSHVFHLAYLELPSQEDLIADVCTYPIIRDPSNFWENKYGDIKRYQSEGLIGPVTKRGIPLHKSWNSLTPEEQKALISLAP